MLLSQATRRREVEWSAEMGQTQPLPGFSELKLVLPSRKERVAPTGRRVEMKTARRTRGAVHQGKTQSG